MATKPKAKPPITDLGRVAELRGRLLYVLLGLVVYRIGTFIPVPGVNSVQMQQFFGDDQSGNILNMFNMFSGGALERLSILALGIMPYITASIIMQMLAVVMPAMEQLKKEGESGRRKITQYTRYFTVVLALVQSIGIAFALDGQGIDLNHIDGVRNISFIFTATVSLVTGAMFLMWLGEKITENGLGNGISLIIFAGIVAGLAPAVSTTLTSVNNGELGIPFVLFIIVLVVGVTAFVVFMERALRKITINYAQRQRGRKVYKAQSSHLPLKLNMAGVIPPIFASSIILFPATLGQWVGSTSAEGELSLVGRISQMLSPGQPVYILMYALAIIFFCFFYTALVFNSRETADNLKKSGVFIPGIRPGENTANYIDSVMTRLTAIGACYITAVCLMPEFLILKFNVSFYFGGTSLLIIVVVVMDFVAQVQAHLMSHQYDGLMQNSNLKR